MLNEDHVDTDRIIPARFLSMITRSGYGELLFADVRGDSFALSQPAAAGASILVAGVNFGCGSSREHAVWALQQAGFRAVIAGKRDDSPGFSDIFRQNASNCGLLLIELEPQDHAAVVEAGSGSEVAIDVEAQTVRLGDQVVRFDISEANKLQILKGLDLIGTTLELESEIAKYEKQKPPFVPVTS